MSEVCTYKLSLCNTCASPLCPTRHEYRACAVRAHIPYPTPRPGNFVRTTKTDTPDKFLRSSETSVFTGLILTEPVLTNPRGMICQVPPQKPISKSLPASTSAYFSPIAKDYLSHLKAFSVNSIGINTSNLCRVCTEPLVPLTAQTGLKCCMPWVHAPLADAKSS